MRMTKKCLLAALKTGKGLVRTNNEDAFYFNGKYPKLSEMDQEVALSGEFHDQSTLFAICDGMGGYENGEIASNLAVSRMTELHNTLASKNFSTSVTEWVEKTNNIINKKARDGGCTLALLYYNLGNIFIAHIGDSRIYRFHHDSLVRITKDHSKLQVLLDAGLLSEEEAKTYPQRHVITRALGMNEEENGKCIPAIQQPINAEKGDRYIICSDGVTDMLTDMQLSEILSRNPDPQKCAEAIFNSAMEAGGKDNTSVIVIEIKYTSEIDATDGSDKDPYESTLTPHLKNTETICIEQITTIRQANGQKLTIKSQISGSQQNGLFSLH